MLSEAIKKIEELAVEAAGPQVLEEHGIKHLVHQGKLTPILEPLVGPLTVRTLGGLVDYLVANRDGLGLKSLMVVVEGPGAVVVYGAARDDGRREKHLMALEPEVSAGFGSFLNRFMPIEDFVVGAQQRFRAGLGDLSALLAVVGNISQNDVRNVADDGTSQEVTAKLGVVKVATTPLPNPCLLVPRRSFPEVILDAVPFVVRVKRGETLPQVGLFEADGGAWQANAAEKISDWVSGAWTNAEVADVSEAPFGILA